MAVFLTGSGPKFELREYTLNNIAKDGSFELGSTSSNGWDSCWDSGGFVTSDHHRGSRSFKFSSGTSNLISRSIGTPIIGHKYYGREYIKTNGTAAAADCRFELNCSDAAGGVVAFGRNEGNYPNWTLISGIGEFTYVSACTLRSFDVNLSGADVWIDSIVVLDLTESFGAGNEPSKEWCDKNIYYFDDQLKIRVFTTSSGRIVGNVLTNLPNGYTPLDYIQSTGSQFINTGCQVTSSNYMQYGIEVEAIKYGSSWQVDGAGEGGSISLHIGVHNSSIYYGNGKQDLSTGITAYPSIRQTYCLDMPKRYAYSTYDMTTLGGLSPSAPTKSAFLYLFAYSTSSGTSYPFAERIYRAKIYMNGVPVKDFVPCMNSQNVIGLYDIIGNQFYSNSGSGTFIGG